MKLMSFMTVYKMKKTDEDRINEVKKHIKNEYIPYEKKADVANAIIHASCFTKDKNGVEILHIDSTAKYMLECMSLIDLFTDLERSKQQGKMLDEFNMLNSEGVFDAIIQCVDKRELKEFNMLIDMIYNDLMTNEYELHSFVKKQVDRFIDLFNVAVSPIISNIDVDQIQKIVAQNTQGAIE